MDLAKKPTRDVESEIDAVLNQDKYPEFEAIKENLDFEKTIKEDPVPQGKHIKKIFGYYKVDLADILKLNLWNRSIYSTDKISRLFLSANFEQQKKYLVKKRQVPMNFWFLIIILMAAGVGIIVLILIIRMSAGGNPLAGVLP